MVGSAAGGDGQRCRILRQSLKLTQYQFAAALGVAEKSLARLEGRAEWGPALARSLRLIERLKPSERASAFRMLWKAPAVGDAGVGAEELDEWCQMLAALRGRARDQSVPATERVESVAAGPQEWCYWATTARADQRDTKELADENMVICRPLRDSRGQPAANLEQLSPGDMLLLLYDGHPQCWYEVREGKTAPQGVDLGVLPRVFKFVQVAQHLGQILLRDRYRNWAGQLPAGANDYFSCISVRPIKRPLLEKPAPRAPGHYATLTALTHVRDTLGP